MDLLIENARLVTMQEGEHGYLLLLLPALAFVRENRCH